MKLISVLFTVSVASSATASIVICSSDQPCADSTQKCFQLPFAPDKAGICAMTCTLGVIKSGCPVNQSCIKPGDSPKDLVGGSGFCSDLNMNAGPDDVCIGGAERSNCRDGHQCYTPGRNIAYAIGRCRAVCNPGYQGALGQCPAGTSCVAAKGSGKGSDASGYCIADMTAAASTTATASSSTSSTSAGPVYANVEATTTTPDFVSYVLDSATTLSSSSVVAGYVAATATNSVVAGYVAVTTTNVVAGYVAPASQITSISAASYVPYAATVAQANLLANAGVRTGLAAGFIIFAFGILFRVL